MGTGIDPFFAWENGIWVTGTGPLGMGNKVPQMGVGLCQLR